MKQIIILLIFLGLICVEMTAQQVIINSEMEFYQQRFKMRVKQIDEFRKRFNYEQDIEGYPIEDTVNLEMRKRYILSLFNENLFDHILPDSVLKLYNDFINTVANKENPIYLDFTDNNWLASTNSKVMLNGKPEEITVFLQPEKIREYEYKWVIIGAKGSILTLSPVQKNPEKIMISPVDNEIKFMSLANISAKSNNDIINYSFSGYTPDNLTVFNTLIYTGQLKILYTQKLSYYYFQVPEYIFRVEQFEHQTDNTGWLIAEIIKIEDKDKNGFLNKLLNDKD